MVNEPPVVELLLFGVHRLGVDVDPPVGLGVHLHPAEGQTDVHHTRQNTAIYELHTRNLVNNKVKLSAVQVEQEKFRKLLPQRAP